MCPNSHEHLFFECTYSTKIWCDLKKRIKHDSWNNKMNGVIDEMVKLPCNKSIMRILRRIVLAACVYQIWNERNKRLFGEDKRSCQVVLSEIINHVRLKLASLTVRRTCKVIEVCNQWQISMNISKDSDCILDKWNDTDDNYGQ
ncbi:reverse transcriptase zinc-binding domain-containing protein [Artemisia annua]|uniref:Reverse transcriptase zinc-binding domain-containing protein n=1 Tax=Artemisia annua TaxID=35608 RepID=A0A2U1N3K8_ARTAN|nr:reverse transcriptase zinc-binding domain-containing protein [Artemisia annua]